jgi:phospholipid/cholesterol/gamma-HCH transport system substrate-binding protein
VRWLTRLTSIAVIAIVVGGAALYIRGKIPTTMVGGGFKTYVKFRDGSRLAPGSPVVIAGVRVGTIDKLTVDGQFARIDMQLVDGLDLPADSFATRRPDSLFGDSYVEIIPDAGEGGAGARRLKSGEPIAHVVEGSSTDAVLRAMADALPRIDNVLDIIHDAVIGGRRWVGGPVLDRLNDTGDWLAAGHIEEPLESARRAMVTIDELTTRGADKLSEAAPEVTRTLDRVENGIVAARGSMRDARSGLVQAMRDTREGLDRIDPQIAQAAEVVTAINEGRGDDWKGTLGRLVNDPALGEQIEDITITGREAVGSFNRFKSWLGMRVEFDWFSRDVRIYAMAEIRARQDKFYLVEFERSPLGGVPRDALSDVANSSAYLRRQEIHDQLRFTAQFGKHFGPISVRGGLKDSTFGAGVDAVMLDGRLKLSADIFGSFQATPRLKVAGALAVFRSIYVLAGVDDALNEPGYLRIVSGNPEAPRTFDELRHGRDYFAGAMLYFTDEDISVLLRLYGALLVGLL